MPTPTLARPLSEKMLYIRVLIFSLLVFGLFYGYLSWLGNRSLLNKAVADTSIFLMGSSMILSGVCYFWNAFDSLIRYRKHLGMVGFAYAIAHVVLSFSALQRLLALTSLETVVSNPAFSGLVATVIFTIMALVSNTKMASLLGGKWWRFILRTGYLAIIFVWLHVVLLKSGRWITWFQEGMPEAPALSLLVSIFMVVVVGMRIALWLSLKRRKSTK